MKNETTKRNKTLEKIVINTNNLSKIKIYTQTALDKESGKDKDHRWKCVNGNFDLMSE
jgi:hypothetical protein